MFINKKLKIRILLLNLIFISTFVFSQYKKNELNKNANAINVNLDVEKLNSTLIKDLENPNYSEVAKKWSKLYDKLPKKYQKTIYDNMSKYNMEYGNLYGLNKGFYTSLCGKYIDNEIFTTIADEYGALGGKSRSQEIKGYRAGMVFFYVKYQILKCKDY
mgnify:CR=1 FL=1